jgi:NhaA family Na+:H+ antiporter
MSDAAPSQTRTADQGAAARLVGPLQRYVRTETGSAGLLLLATLCALLWANSPWSVSYTDFWGTDLSVRLGDGQVALDLRHWVNDGLMVFFFFVLGLEVKRELVLGELADRRRAAVPLVAALTGLAVPALVYLAFNRSGEGLGAWGVVISTDTAFLLGVLALVGPACPARLRIFLLTLAVADDVGALTVIALFYTAGLALVPLALAAGGIVLILLLRFLRVWRGPGYFVVAVGIWLAMYASGVHPTIAGVVIALLTPVYPPRRSEVEDADRATRAYRQSPDPSLARAARLSIERSVSPNERLQRLYHPWTSYVIVPLFALANAGVTLDRESLAAAVRSPLTLGIVAGLVLGKPLGVLGGTLLAVRLGVGRLPAGLGWLQVVGGAALSGLGFTIALFIIDLALDDPVLAEQARIGVLTASVLAASLGWAVFRLVDRRGPAGPVRPVVLEPPVAPGRDHVRGPTGAPLTLLEFGDFECPFCGRATGSVDEIRAHFGDRLRYVFRHLPLPDVHPHATVAAQAAEAAGAQGRFWEMHDQLFAHSDRLAPEDLLEHAAELDLDVGRFAEDLRQGRHEGRVDDDLLSAEASGATGTPTFFVNGRRHSGPFDSATLIAALDPDPTTVPAADDAVAGAEGRAP